MEGRKPVSALASLHLGEITQEPEYLKKKLRDMDPDQGGNRGLGVARVVDIDYEEHFVTLRTLVGTQQEFERVPVPLTYPGAGARHFFGAMPEVGDYCIVGWLPQDTTEARGTRTPVILSWILPGVWPGRDWLTTAEYTEDEHDQGTSRNREEARGGAERIRHKLRHIQPGNIVGSSSQGADLVLDENVHLANRRGNEFLLRDADQAVVTRALQQFTALAGSRTYAGMVQRDALRLPTTMFSDGFFWDSEVQAPGGVPVPQEELGSHPSAARGYLTPADPFHRASPAGKPLTGALDQAPADMDPYQFLRRGGYIDEDGIAVDDRHLNDAVYAGKNIYRVLGDSQDNGALRPGAAILTEHRIEVTHTSTGLLPVTEQTDGFDAERLPPSDPDTPGTANQPFIEWVLGSVVGNEPFSARGRREYGIPLTAQVFDDMGGLGPRISPVRIGSTIQGTSGTPLGEHAATLFKLTPITGGLAPTWWSVNKQGQVRASISGPTNGSGFDMAVAGGMRLAVGGGLELILNGGIHFATQSKNSLRLRSEQGPVVIYGGGSAQGDESLMEQEYGSAGGEDTVPAVDIRARTSARLWAERQVLVKGQTVETNASTVRSIAGAKMEMQAQQITQTAEDIKVVVNGKRSDTFIGPKNLLPTSGALHERSYNPMYPGLVCEEVTYLWGDRNERFNLGNHTTNVLIGNMTYRTLLGSWTAQAGLNTLEVNTVTGITGRAIVGDATLTAVAGSASMKGIVSASMESVGPATVRSGTVVRLAAPPAGPDIGPVLCAGSLEPFTMLPYATWGMGAKTVLVAPI